MLLMLLPPGIMKGPLSKGQRGQGSQILHLAQHLDHLHASYATAMKRAEQVRDVIKTFFYAKAV
eukprot:813658-Pelagomonas_calceolata.AAC.2